MKAPAIRLTPEYLNELIPPEWRAVAERLTQIQAEYLVPAERMRLFIRIGAQMDIPLAMAVENMANGQLQLIEVPGEGPGEIQGYQVIAREETVPNGK